MERVSGLEIEVIRCRLVVEVRVRCMSMPMTEER